MVDSDASARLDRLRLIMIHGTSLSLAFAVPVCIGLSITAGPIIAAWVGPSFQDSVIVTQLLLAVVLVRVGLGSANVILKGAGQHRLAGGDECDDRGR